MTCVENRVSLLLSPVHIVAHSGGLGIAVGVEYRAGNLCVTLKHGFTVCSAMDTLCLLFAF